MFLNKRSQPAAVTGQAGKVSELVLLIVVWVGFAIAAVLFILRLAIRLILNSKLEFDDAFVALAVCILLAHAVIVTLIADPMYDILRASQPHSTFVPPPDFMQRSTFYLKGQFTATCLFWSCLWAVKAGFLVFYKKLIEGIKYLKWIWWGMATFTLVSYMAAVISYPVSCTSFTLGKCETPRNISLSLFSLRMSTALDVVTDAMIIALPIFLVSKIKLNFRTKMAVASVFLMGGLITVFAIVRIIVTNQVSVHPEVSWLNLWSAIECSIAVSVCCLMVFKQLLTRRKMGGYSQNGYGSSGYAGGSSLSRNADRKEERETSSPAALLESRNGHGGPCPDDIALGSFTFVEGGRPTHENNNFRRDVRFQRNHTFLQG